MEVHLFKKLILLFVVLKSVKSDASGCDSSFFMSGNIVQQRIIRDYGQLRVFEAQKVINSMYQSHKMALHYWNQQPVLKASSKLKIIATTYKGLDTDCGWSKFGSILTIIHLDIETEQGKFYFPDIYKDVYPEYQGLDKLIMYRR